ncbi:hypothetical protein F8O01_12140 [Pseudoclavibacter chungangensis]|uniref:Uncharacterized protein n=1 Tax=Pseudoclavibacter chungangensis TaxID=587635 RepID=A0A7J5BPT5_9MICO|nr:hypothetical protein [Pseudoclavibacter chungangensis]KAB1655368.1 hypothetical protein F8O01_12140 [Pseudoclavibacter chungangensis]NYJ68318.1 hypothetical protein [Pseudoclavibacter chungangensis]
MNGAAVLPGTASPDSVRSARAGAKGSSSSASVRSGGSRWNVRAQGTGDEIVRLLDAAHALAEAGALRAPADGAGD